MPANPFRTATFLTSAHRLDQLPPDGGVEVAFCGRSNAGKSSALNAICDQSGLARTSRTPGRTRLLNWFEVEGRFNLVDLPGYGYAAVDRDLRAGWQPLIEEYLSRRDVLAGVLLLIDVRRGPEEEELDFVPWLEAKKIPIVVALTKADKLPKNKRMLEIAKAKKTLGLKRDPFAVSAQDGEGLDPLWRALDKLVR